MTTKLIQFLFSVGPIALAIMGVVVSVNPPQSKKSRNGWIWVFVIVGIISAAAIFIEVSNSDNAIDEMSEKIASLEKLAKRAPRLEFSGIKTSIASNGNTLATIRFTNTSDIDAVSYRAVGGVGPRTEWPTQADFDELDKALASYSLSAMPNGAYLSRGMGLGLPPIEVNQTDVENYTKNGPLLYLIAIVEYAPKIRENGDYWRTEVCAKITKPFTDFEACPLFQQYKHMRDGKTVND